MLEDQPENIGKANEQGISKPFEVKRPPAFQEPGIVTGGRMSRKWIFEIQLYICDV